MPARPGPQAHGRGRGQEAHRPRPRCGGRSSKTRSKPRVYYLNLPKKFIAGTVYDPKEEEVIIGATVTLTAPRAAQALTIETDAYGDFWFEGLADGTYDLEIKSGRQGQDLHRSGHRVADINLGDIPLT